MLSIIEAVMPIINSPVKMKVQPFRKSRMTMSTMTPQAAIPGLNKMRKAGGLGNVPATTQRQMRGSSDPHTALYNVKKKLTIAPTARGSM